MPNRRDFLAEWKITPEELNELLNENPSLRGMTSGYIAEFKLRKVLERIPELKYLGKPRDHDRKKKYDQGYEYKGHEIRVEVKSLQTNSVRDLGDGKFVGRFQCDASDARKITFPDGSTLSTTNLLRGQFDIVAVPLFAFIHEWDFVFALNRDLPGSTESSYSDYHRGLLLAGMMPLDYPPNSPYTENFLRLCDAIIVDLASSHRP